MYAAVGFPAGKPRTDDALLCTWTPQPVLVGLYQIIRMSYYLASLYNMKLLFEQRLDGLQLILALGHARHSLGQTEIHKKHLRLGLAAIWHNHNVLVVQIVDQNLAAMHLPQGLLSVWQ